MPTQLLSGRAPAGGSSPRATKPSATSAFGLLLLAVGLTCLVSILTGSNPIPVDLVLHALTDRGADVDTIVWGSRVPRTLLGLLVGGCLGMAGAVMQGQTGNPLADPGLFGVSSGASLAVVLGVFVFGVNSTWLTLWLSLLGAVIASVLVFTVAGLGRDLASPVPLAIAGTAVTALLSALTSVLVLRDQESLEAYRIWVVGSLSGRTLDGVGWVLTFAVIGLACALGNAGSLNNLALGTELATGLGEHLWRARLVGLAAITLLTAAAVAVAGPIGFVGLTAPHLARALVGSDHRRLLPAAALVGMISILACDVIGRLIGIPAEVSVGVVLAAVGGVAFVLIVRKAKLAAL